MVDLAGCIRRQAWLLGLAECVVLDDVPPILGRAAEIEQLMANLLANSARYTPAAERPRIHISARRVEPAGTSRVVVTVRDHGIGIPAEELDSVFDRERRGSNVVVEGHGLGLAICADIARGHGGDIRAVLPEDGGPGACIEVVLPAASDTA